MLKIINSSFFLLNLSMGKVEIKNEINKALDEVPEEVLAQVLDLLKQYSSTKDSSFSLLGGLDKLLSEDKELLRKLAQ